MNYQPFLEPQVIQRIRELPAEAFDVLVDVMIRVCEDPYERLVSMPFTDTNPRERMAELGDSAGWIEFEVIEATRQARVHALVWVG